MQDRFISERPPEGEFNFKSFEEDPNPSHEEEFTRTRTPADEAFTGIAARSNKTKRQRRLIRPADEPRDG